MKNNKISQIKTSNKNQTVDEEVNELVSEVEDLKSSMTRLEKQTKAIRMALEQYARVQKILNKQNKNKRR